LLKRLLFLHRIFFSSFVKDKLVIVLWLHIWVLYSVPLLHGILNGIFCLNSL
jgi:hypothetical protein